MPRKYKRKLGARAYRNYSVEKLEEALNEIREKKISMRGAAEKYGIHRNTLWLKLHTKHTKTHGGVPIFTEVEENGFIAHTIAMSTYGFPITPFDLRSVVKAYLDRTGRKVKRFKHNFPGTDWVKSFINRHKDILTQRIARNITHARAKTDEDIINQYFDNLELETQDIPPSNIWNYDETNLVDDPGSKKIITKRGTKYPERIRNASKACTSLMVCGNAEGQLAPLYVNYKSHKIWSTWTENGPPGARYNRTSSGWFDYQIFEDWFTNLMLPLLKKQDGKKILIGDNLSSHLNVQVIQLCEANNISFIALPPNATHLLQPLDVAYFRSMKGAWRRILDAWKESPSGSRYTSIPKDQFPTLLKKLMESLAERGTENLKSGFKKTGIYPINRTIVLDRLPNRVMDKEDDTIKQSLGDSFLEQLINKRDEATHGKRIKRRKLLNVPAGKSISVADVLPMIEEQNKKKQLKIQKEKKNKPRKKKQSKDKEIVDLDNPQPSTSCPGNSKKKNTNKRQRGNSETSSDSDTNIMYEESDNSSYHESCSSNSEPEENVELIEMFEQEANSVGDYVLIVYENKMYPGVITKVNDDGAFISAMEKLGKHWKWPNQKDEIWYKNDEILQKINKPRQRGSREIFDIPELSIK